MVADLDALDDTTDESDDEDDFDDVDYVTAAVLRDRLCLELDLHHHSEDVRCLNNIASPVQTIRDTLLLMPQDTDEDRDAIRSRLSKVKTSLAGYRSSLRKRPPTAWWHRTARSPRSLCSASGLPTPTRCSSPSASTPTPLRCSRPRRPLASSPIGSPRPAAPGA